MLRAGRVREAYFGTKRSLLFSRFLTQMYARFRPRQVGHRSGKTLRMCPCRYAAVQSSVAQPTAACAGPALGGGGLLGGSLTRRKLLMRWRLHGDEPRKPADAASTFADVPRWSRTPR